MIPVLLPQASAEPALPAFLAGNAWVDLQQGLADDAALWRFECGILGVPPGRGRSQPQRQPNQTQNVSPAPHTLNLALPEITMSQTNHPAHVFISYRHQEPDQSLALICAEALRTAGHNTSIDTGIRWGANWAEQIREFLEHAEYVLLFLSPEAVESEMVIEEVAMARELAQRHNGVPVILLVRVRYPFTEPLPYHLAAYS